MVIATVAMQPLINKMRYATAMRVATRGAIATDSSLVGQIFGAARRYAFDMAELRADRPATILDLLVDEGTMVAEEDPVVALDGPEGPMAMAVTVPGVLREWFVQPGDTCLPGDVLAIIDES